MENAHFKVSQVVSQTASLVYIFSDCQQWALFEVLDWAGSAMNLSMSFENTFFGEVFETIPFFLEHNHDYWTD